MQGGGGAQHAACSLTDSICSQQGRKELVSKQFINNINESFWWGTFKQPIKILYSALRKDLRFITKHVKRKQTNTLAPKANEECCSHTSQLLRIELAAETGTPPAVRSTVSVTNQRWSLHTQLKHSMLKLEVKQPYGTRRLEPLEVSVHSAGQLTGANDHRKDNLPIG